MTIQTSDNKFGPARWIVDPTIGLGTHTTIQGAIDAASSGETIFLRPGTYSEDITLKAGLTITSFLGEAEDQNVVLNGKISASYSGSSSISNIRMQTNGDFSIELTGSNATNLQINDCFFKISDNTCISSSNSNVNSSLTLDTCNGDIETTGITFFSWASPGTLFIERCKMNNSGASSTASTASDGNLKIQYCILFHPITTSGTNKLDSFISFYSTANTNTTTMTVGGSGANGSNGDQLFPGSASAVSVSTNLTARNTLYSSGNANIVTGAGNFTYTNIYLGTGTGTLAASSNVGAPTYTGQISFDGGTNNLDYYETGTWTPTLTFGGGSTGIVYTFQQGRYTRIGNIVYYHIFLQISNKGTSTGNAGVSGFPFTVSTGENYVNPLGGWARLTPPANFTGIGIRNLAATTTADIVTSSNAGGAFINMDDTMFANSSLITTEGFYYV